MRKDEDGNPCPATLGEYREYCVAFFGEDSEATKFLDEKIKHGSPKDKVIVTDREMREVFYRLTETILIPKS